MRTTLTLDDEIILGIKRIRKKRPDETFKQVVNSLMKRGLEAEGEISNTPFRIKPMKNAKPKPGLDFDNVWKLLSEVEGDLHK